MRLDRFVGVELGACSPDLCASAVRFYDFMERAGFVGRAGDPLRTAGATRAPIDLYRSFNQVFWSSCYPAYMNAYGVLESVEARAGATIGIGRTAPGAAAPTWHDGRVSQAGGKHLVEWLVFLDAVDEGGELEFHHLGLTVEPAPGALVVWPSAFTHACTLRPPRSGPRHTLWGWVET